MALLRRSPFRLLNQFNRRMEEALSEQEDDGASGSLSQWRPRTDIYEEDDHLTFEVEVPGLDTSDLDVSFENGRLTVSGERRPERDVDEGDRNYYRSERVYGPFQRTFALSQKLDPDKIEAEYEDGVLNIRVPKPEQGKRRSIEIG